MSCSFSRAMLAVFLLAVTLSANAAQYPYPVQPDARKAVHFSVSADGKPIADAALSWSAAALILDVRVTDTTPVRLQDAGVGLSEAYLADSVEFWVGRHQFVMAPTTSGVQLWDYLYQEVVPGAVGTWRSAPDGYALHMEVPWGPLGVTARPLTSRQFALQINDRQRVQDNGGWKSTSRQTLYPPTATFDRPSTYATIFLNQDVPVRRCAVTPVPFARMETRSYAYAKQTDCLVQRHAAFVEADLLLRVLDAAGKTFAELPIPKGPGEQRLSLPWDEQQAGIYTAAVFLRQGTTLFGPITEPYFNAGKTDIAHYVSPREAPADLEPFWQGNIAAMRQRPFAAVREPYTSPWRDVVVEKVRITNHRGNPMIVYISRRTADTGKLPATMNVYPPMAAVKPEWPSAGHLAITFCGSLQGEARLPDQARNETLWARAESLQESYWLDVVLDGVRALDFAAAQPYSDGTAMVNGGSRGGWYTFALAAVAPDRVSQARFTSPCYSDITMNRQLGYASAASEVYTTLARDEKRTGGKVFATFRYFDPLFLATMVRTPMIFSAGLQDSICSAVGMTAAAHNIKYPATYFLLDPEGGHGGSPTIPVFYRLFEQRP